MSRASLALSSLLTLAFVSPTLPACDGADGAGEGEGEGGEGEGEGEAGEGQPEGALCGYFEAANPDTRLACATGLMCFDDGGRSVNGGVGELGEGVSDFAVCATGTCDGVSCEAPNVCFVHPEDGELFLCLALDEAGGSCDSFGGTGQCPFGTRCDETDFKQGTCVPDP